MWVNFKSKLSKPQDCATVVQLNLNIREEISKDRKIYCLITLKIAAIFMFLSFEEL